MSAVQRINDSVLGPLERPALAWLVRRLPPKVVPDHLTAFGVFGALLTATGMASLRYRRVISGGDPFLT